MAVARPSTAPRLGSMGDSSESAQSATSSPSQASSVTSTDETAEPYTEGPGRVSRDPTAIVGLACRVPGAQNPSKLWDNILKQKDIQRKMPEERFKIDNFYNPDGTNKGTTNATAGYFLEQDLSVFDNEFFHISGKEAEAMDPQQRLLLEVVYEALEDAGIPMDEISGSSTSVYCGSFTNDYKNILNNDLGYYPKYAATGIGNAILSNRISYFYDLHGPSMTIDTACSSSLICFHFGNKSVQDDGADLSVVVGSALHFDPNMYVMMTDVGFLSTDGRCRAFDASGKGYVRGEGVCAAILKKQSRAEQDGNPIRALVRGTNTNHDGTKDGITMPNSYAQESLIRSTYKNAGLDTRETQYFEAHGTGTQAGDPREARAIGAVFAPNRETPLYVGSVKTNLGHLEGASGLAGIIKTTMALENEKIPPNMLFNNPNPNINFQKLSMTIPTKLLDWKTTGGVRRASINSFGYGGANAHVILEGYTAKPKLNKTLLSKDHTSMTMDRPLLLPLTSHSVRAGDLLKDQLNSFFQEEATHSTGSLARSLSTHGRSMHQVRSFVIAKDRNQVTEGLAKPLTWTRSGESVKRLGFVFTGQGAQFFSMGRQLIQQSPLFRQALDRCDSILQSLPEVDRPEWTCVGELLRTKEDSRVSQSTFSQPLCTAIQLALVDQLAKWGIKPSITVGHSSGEMGAAYAAGILSFEDAIMNAYYRGRVFQMETKNKVQVPGSMMAVQMSEAEAIQELQKYEGRIKIAAVNSPTSLTLSGDEPAIDELKDVLAAKGTFHRKLQVDKAYHSHHIAPYGPLLNDFLSNIRPMHSKCPMSSSVTARMAEPKKMQSKYWVSNLTGQVRFCDAVTNMLLNDEEEVNVDALIEVGPHHALKGPVKEIMKSLKLDIPYVPTLSRGTPDFEALLTCAGQLFSLGYNVDLPSVNSNIFIDAKNKVRKLPCGPEIKLPSYAWDHGTKHWSDTRVTKALRERTGYHEILGAPVADSVENHPRWRRYLRPAEIPWLSQHMIQGKIIFPAAGYICIALEAALRLERRPERIQAINFRDVSFKSAMPVRTDDMGTEVMTELQPAAISAKRVSDSWYRFTINSYDANGRCDEHCYGSVELVGGLPSAIDAGKPSPSLAELKKSCDRTMTLQRYYEHLWSMGLQYGEDFQLLSGNVESGPGCSVAPLTFQRSQVASDLPSSDCMVHPTLLDAAFHAIFAACEADMGRSLGEPFVPTFVKSLKVSGLMKDLMHSEDQQRFWVDTKSQIAGPRTAKADLAIRSQDCSKLMIDLQCGEFTALGGDEAGNAVDRVLFYRTRWLPSFSLLGTNTSGHSFESIGQAMELFVHQVPDAKILHLSSNKEAILDVLHHITDHKGYLRNFQSLTPYAPSVEGVPRNWDGMESLRDKYLDRVLFEEPQASSYDAVIIQEDTSLDIKSFLKPGGFVLSDGPAFKAQDLTPTFNIRDISAWQYTTESQSSEKLTLIMPLSVSERTELVASCIEKQHSGPITRTNLLSVLESKAELNGDVIVLASLENHFFFDEESDSAPHFEAIRHLLTTGSKNLVWITEGASKESENPRHAMITGLARAARSENEDLRLVTLDFSMKAGSQKISDRALQVLGRRLGEDEFAERDGKLLIPKLEPDTARNSKLPSNNRGEARFELFDQERPLSLKIGKVGLLDTLAFTEDTSILDNVLGADEIEMDVKASAINFRDIAASMGIIDDFRLGDECAGVIRRIGSAVDTLSFKEEDHVVCWRPGQGAHSSVLRSPADVCHKIPNMTFANAASFPLILTTAYFALQNSARLQAGETVLIHSAAGGVGQMAIQVAHMLGAKVIATVGSQAKREFIRDQFGIDESHILSSRDSTFVQGVLDLTDGRGVDVALNSLAGELLHGTWSCMARFGRFIEIGKRDIHENSKLDMDAFRKNVSFASVDMITVYEYNRSLGSRVFKDCCRLIESGAIKLPETVAEYPYSEAQKAFRVLQMGKHLGKVVLTSRENDLVPVLPPTYRNKTLFDQDKTYLLVGGLGGLGRTLAEWMVRKGARKLAFLSRSGANRPEAASTVQWLEARDIETSVFKVDVTSYTAVKECIEKLGPSLAGIFQAAMVLQDSPLDKMTYDQWQTCVRPKVRGTYNLHLATMQTKLDFFVCFSSASAIIGTMGQANYAAANTYLDSLMSHRRSIGLEGSTMNCGMIVGVGAVAEDKHLESLMIRMGFDPVNEEELLYQIEEAVTSRNTPGVSSAIDEHQTVTGLNINGKDFYWATKPMIRNVYSNLDIGDVSSASAGKSLIATLREDPELEARVPILTEAFIEKISAVLGVPIEGIQPINPLSAYGLDSIVAIELRKWFVKSINVDVQVFDVLGSKSITELVTKAAKLIKDEEDAGPVQETAKPGATDTKKSAIEGEQTQTTSTASSDLQVMQKPKNIPMSTFQRRLWFQHQFLEDKSALNLPVIGYLKGEVNLSLLKDALRETKKRNDSLHMAFFEGDNFSEQRPTNDFEPRIDYKDLSDVVDAEAALQKYVNELKQQELSIEDGEVMRMTLAKLASDQYACVMIYHHITIDRGSSMSINKQMMSLYDAMRKGERVETVPAPKVSYIEFTLWHNARLEQPDLQTSIDFWKKKLDSAPSASKLLPFAQATHALSEAVTIYVQSHEADMLADWDHSVFQFLMASLRSFHFRYTEEEDLTIHMVDSGRPHPDLEETLGFFVNLVPIRLTEAGDADFSTLLRYTRDSVLEATKHNGVPFDAIVDSLGVRKVTSHLPLGQIILNYQSHGKMPKLKTEDFEVYDLTNGDIPTAAEMQLEAMEDGDNGLALRLEYSSTLYGSGEMDRFFDNFVYYLTSIIKDYRQPIAEIEMCGPKEIDYLKRNLWNTTTSENSWDKKPVVEMFLDMAKKHPTINAIEESDGESITYEHLAAQATRIAASLQQCGASSGDVVGVVSRPGVEAISAMLGALLIGCGYLAMDPEFANERLSFMASDAGARFLLVADELMEKSARPIAEAMTFMPPHIIPMSEARGCEYPLFPSAIEPDNICYIVYTSGSTGKPKGVALKNSNTQQMLSTLHHDFNFTPGLKFLQQSSICFDLSIVQIFSPLTSGGTICVAKPELRKDPERLAAYMQSAQIGCTYFTPTQFALLLETGSDHLRQCSSYTTAFFAGETLPVRLAKAFYDLSTPASAYNTWSPSELVVQTTIGKVAYPDASTISIPIGYPLANCRHYVLDANMKPLPACITGELCVGGAQVGAGYLNRPDVTANAFISDPFRSEQDTKAGWNTFFRTGDRGRFRSDGQLEFHGRIAGSTQIKLRGFRIDLGEIEHRIHLEFASTRGRKLVDLAVVAVPQKQSSSAPESGEESSLTDDRQLVAFLVCSQLLSTLDKQELITSIHERLSHHLNYYMLPSAYQFLTSLPVTIGGKVDRKQFLTMDIAPFYPGGGSTAPFSSTPITSSSLSSTNPDGEDDVLQKVIKLFKETLKLPEDHEVKPTDNFFELGGQSILLLRAHSKLKKVFKIAPPLKELFTAATPLDMARKVRECVEEKEREKVAVEKA
ncbi:putative Hybrid PKS-NRPS biosynthetic cluster [Bacidia gigantensis]|uniref:putative Hybrid PKS-NRPS biosynthetic cluster n=1 Tax=Bacidia gigantensis TaxID=2732470 RepID=UPI001D041DEA|nr:putative Hybrid PKS-NRPS biosynthetic cluster [Bacidia gigantensis]KAG8528377.1 putative Hybrid PKS-NRPS biosynthetic cluster [Bacidia gigantensis]